LIVHDSNAPPEATTHLDVAFFKPGHPSKSQQIPSPALSAIEKEHNHYFELLVTLIDFR
jgi:hypothetical protein